MRSLPKIPVMASSLSSINVSTPPQSGLTSADYNYVKYWVSLIRVAKGVFKYLFISSYKGGSSSIKDYLFNNLNYTNKVFKNNFAALQRSMIENNIVDDFDLTLLYSLLQRICGLPSPDSDVWEKSDPKEKLPNLLYVVKMKRNDYAHSVQNLDDFKMKNEIDDLKYLLMDILTEAGKVFNLCPRDISSYKDELDKELTEIKNAPFPTNNIFEQLQNIRKEKISIMLNEGKQELYNFYSSQTQMLLASWPLSDIYRPINDIYTDISLKLNRYYVMRNKLSSKESRITTKDVLKFEQSDGTTPDFILVAGNTGMGKTTFLKYVINDWVTGNNHVTGSDDYEFVLYIDCRGCQYESVEEMIIHLMPKTSGYFNKEELVALLFSTNVLIILDNLNEINSKTLKVFDKILQSNSITVKILATTNFKDANEIVDRAQCRKILRLELEGVPKNDLISKLQQVVELENTNPNLNTKKFLNKSLPRQLSEQNNHLQSPEVLTHLFYHWIASKNDNDSLYTVTFLFLKSQNILVTKLKEKIQKRYLVSFDECQLLKYKILDFLSFLGTIAIKTLLNNSIELDFEALTDLFHKCENLDLPPQVVLGEFLTVQQPIDIKLSSTCMGVKFPSKSFQEFYCAYYIYQAIESSNDQIENIRNLVTRNGNKIDNLTRIQSVLKYLIGLLYINCNNKLVLAIPKIVELLKQTGVDQSKEWLLYVEEALSCSELVKAIAMEMDESWNFDDYYISDGIISLLKFKSPKNLNLTTCIDPKDLVRFGAVIQCCTKLPNLTIKLHIYHHFWQDTNNTSDSYLKPLLKDNTNCKLVSFAGKLTNDVILNLPSTLQRLALNIIPKNIKSLNKTIPKMSNLELLYLNFNITPDISPNVVNNLDISTSSSLAVDLWHLSADSIEWACNVAQNLCQFYNRMALRKTSLTPVDVKSFISGMHKRRAIVQSLIIGSTSSITDIEMADCRVLAKNIQCSDFKWLKL